MEEAVLLLDLSALLLFLELRVKTDQVHRVVGKLPPFDHALTDTGSRPGIKLSINYYFFSKDVFYIQRPIGPFPQEETDANDQDY